jgi:hypothetical protein
MQALLPKQSLGGGGEVCRRWWSYPCCRWHVVGPLPAGPGLSQAMSGADGWR